MFQMHLNQNNVFWKLFDHEEFATLRNVANNTMKEHHSNLLGTLGELSPLQLLTTVIYMLGMFCALKGCNTLVLGESSRVMVAK